MSERCVVCICVRTVGGGTYADAEHTPFLVLHMLSYGRQTKRKGAAQLGVGATVGEGVSLSHVFHILSHFWERLSTISSSPRTIRSFRIVHCASLGMRKCMSLDMFEFGLIQGFIEPLFEMVLR